MRRWVTTVVEAGQHVQLTTVNNHLPVLFLLDWKLIIFGDPINPSFWKLIYQSPKGEIRIRE